MAKTFWKKKFEKEMLNVLHYFALCYGNQLLSYKIGSQFTNDFNCVFKFACIINKYTSKFFTWLADYHITVLILFFFFRIMIMVMCNSRKY